MLEILPNGYKPNWNRPIVSFIKINRILFYILPGASGQNRVYDSTNKDITITYKNSPIQSKKYPEALKLANKVLALNNPSNDTLSLFYDHRTQLEILRKMGKTDEVIEG